MGEQLSPVDKLHHEEQPLLGLEEVLQRCEKRVIVGSEDLVLRHYLRHLTGEPSGLGSGRTAIEVGITLVSEYPNEVSRNGQSSNRERSGMVHTSLFKTLIANVLSVDFSLDRKTFPKVPEPRVWSISSLQNN